MSQPAITTIRNFQLTGARGRPFLLDAYYVPNGQPKPVVLFVHGYKGFKDWGHWKLIAHQFANRGYIFIKFNFSHNGTTITHPETFEDLEAFGNNNYTHELADIDTLINWLHSSNNAIPAIEADLRNIAIIGHSRGGATAIIKAARDTRIKALATWAAVAKLDYAWSNELVDKWKNEGVYYITNGRTGQKMPMYYQMYLDFLANRNVLDVEKALRGFDKPMLILHGTSDPAVPHTSAATLHRYYTNATLHLIDGADHVFGGQHPFIDTQLPDHTEELTETTLDFFDQHLIKP